MSVPVYVLLQAVAPVSGYLLVYYYASPDHDGPCERDGCEGDANFTVVAAGGSIEEHLCDRHTAQHMRGNAYALVGADGMDDVKQAEIFNELDEFDAD